MKHELSDLVPNPTNFEFKKFARKNDLRKYFPSDTSSGILMNSEFNKWEEEIKTKVTKYDEKEERYEKDQELLQFAQKHIEKHSKKIRGEQIICLVHPFYLSLTHLQYITKKTAQDYKLYFENLKTILEKKPLEIIVFDTLYHYSAITSMLLEKELIDKVILTNSHQGIVFDKTEIPPLKEKRKYMGGGYYGDCLKTTSNQLRKKETQRGNLWAIQDLILVKPNYWEKNLLPKEIDLALYDGITWTENLIPKKKNNFLEKILPKLRNI